MHIKIPQHKTRSSLSSVRTRDMIRAILILSGCSNVREKTGQKRTVEFYAEKVFPFGRIHVKASCIEGYYVMDVHYDSEKHLKRPHRITKSKSFSLHDCLEVRKFLNQFVLPIILANRTHYHFKIDDKWYYANSLLDETKAVSVWRERV